MAPISVDALSQEVPVAKITHVKGGQSEYVAGSQTDYTIIEQPSRASRPIRILCVGAGASAINFAHEVEESKLDLELVCYDKNPSIGGTWYENKYPGCGCDIPSVNYQLSWAPSSKWSSL
jgi:hypothetical protein